MPERVDAHQDAKGCVECHGRVSGMITLPFYAFYSFVRGVLRLVFLYKMAVFYLSGEVADVVPYVDLFWVVIVAGSIAVSIL